VAEANGTAASCGQQQGCAAMSNNGTVFAGW
jgi:hypothetical protein